MSTCTSLSLPEGASEWRKEAEGYAQCPETTHAQPSGLVLAAEERILVDGGDLSRTFNLEGNIRGEIVLDTNSLSATPAPTRARIQDSDDNMSPSHMEDRRELQGTEVLSPGDFIYPFTDARYVEQSDVLEDGHVPEQRAGPPPKHMMLHARKLAVRHLPQMDADGRCDPFLVLTFDQQKRSTQVAKNVYEYSYRESFEFFVHELHIEFAKSLQVSEGASCGIGLLIECFDWDRLSSNDYVGKVSVDLLVLCSLVETAKHLTFVLCTTSGDPVMGKDGLPCEVDVELEMLPTHRSWYPPTLSKSLSMCESRPESREISISMLHRLSSISAGYFFHKSSHSLSGSFSYKRAERPPDPERRGSQVNLKFPSRTPELQVEPEVDDLFADADEKDIDYDEEPSELYWRERLEKAMESMWVNIMVLGLVMLDLSNILVYTFYYSTDSEQPWQTAVNFTVMSLFLLELSLRQIAQRKRFWSNMWNIFDFFVVWLSIGVLVVKQIFESQSGVASSLQSTKSTATSLRVFSRIAMVMRFVRVLITVRRARMLSGAVSKKLRKAVSQNKRRYKKHGYNLDLTYITDRIIAMSAPAFGGHTAFRNDIHMVSRFLSQRHYGKFFIFNLCDTYNSSDGVMGNYHPQLLFNQVQRIPFEDHAPPLLSELIFMCQESCAWMSRDRQNTIAVHCKGGKGRTGVMIAGLLMWTGHRRCALDALELFTYRRTQDYIPEDGLDEDIEDGVGRRNVKHNQGVQGPSQLRYVYYLEAVLYSGVDPWSVKYRFMEKLTLRCNRFMEKYKSVRMSYVVKCQRTVVLDSLDLIPPQEVMKTKSESEPYGVYIELSTDVLIWADVRIDFFIHPNVGMNSKRKLAFFVMFHTSFYEGRDLIVFHKRNVDMLHKDSSNQMFDQTFHLQVHLKPETKLLFFDGASSDRLIEAQIRSFQLMFTHNEFAISMTLRKGEYLTKESFRNDYVYFIQKGAVEGVLKDDNNVMVQFHSLGNSIPDENNRQNVRVPILCIFGSGSVVLGADFLYDGTFMSLRAREDKTQVICLVKRGRTVQASQAEGQTTSLLHISYFRSVHQGVLKKRGWYNLSWKDRYFVLKGQQLEYYSSEGAFKGNEVAKGNINLRDCHVSEHADSECLWAFAIQDVMQNRTFYCAALNEQERAMWISQIQQASKLSSRMESNQQDLTRISSPKPYKTFFIQKLIVSQESQGSQENDQARDRELLRSNREKSGSEEIDVEKISIEGLRTARETSSFYKSLSILLAIRLDRIQMEMIRMASLKALNDRSILPEQDAKERLRTSCIRTFGLPLTERLLRTFKCKLRRPELRKEVKMRIMFFNRYVILDPLIYGPVIDLQSQLMPVAAMESVAFKDRYQQTTLIIRVSTDCEGSSTLYNTFELAFASCHRAFQVLSLLKRNIADHKASASTEAAHRQPSFASILDRYGKVHRLERRSEFALAHRTASIFFVFTGQVKLKRLDDVYKILDPGACFGLTNFVQQKVSGHFHAQVGDEQTTILEIPREVNELLEDGTGADSMQAMFYHAVCVLLEHESRFACSAYLFSLLSS